MTTQSTDQFSTPMLRQYAEIKAGYQDAILFFRLGDFYEMFLDDALIASKELELTLTGRGKDSSRIPMCGLPYHAADSYISKLVSRGFKVAICEQVEDASLSKGITKREVVKVITPGTVNDAASLTETENNYLMAIHSHKSTPSFGVSFIDITTGEFKLLEMPTATELNALIEQLAPKELLLGEDSTLQLFKKISTTIVNFQTSERAEEELCRYFKIQSLSGLGIAPFKSAFPAAWAILDYVRITQKNSVPQINSLKVHSTDQYLFLDTPTIQNLELTHSITGHPTLFKILKHTKTAMGARALKQLILNPLTDIGRIHRRQDSVEALLLDRLSREELRESLAHIYDIERLTSRLNSHTPNPRDLISLKQSLSILKEISAILDQVTHPALEPFGNFFKATQAPESPIQEILTLIEENIIDEPPVNIRDGHIFKPSNHPALKALLTTFQEIRDWINTLEPKERELTGIRTLKVGFNKVFGYYFEVSQGQIDKVPPHYIRKQTLVNGERYITPELKEKEIILLNGEDQQKKLEQTLYAELIQKLIPHIPSLQKLALMISTLDCIQSLATAAQKYNYKKPIITDTPSLEITIKNGRHPIVEQSMSTPFISNSITMSNTHNRLIFITGPNMAGKSTFMRQLALLIIMAQMGSFIPADSATISIVDKLFTRIGASDNLAAGQSTFMVEMLETSAILNTATYKSLILLDEIGRGTATFDGMSLACAITEYIHQDIGARTLFATHYHELTILADHHKEIANYNMKISEIDGHLVFEHKFVPGPADKSYGIHVAKMAGLPKKIITAAESHLNGFELHGATYLKTLIVN